MGLRRRFPSLGLVVVPSALSSSIQPIDRARKPSVWRLIGVALLLFIEVFLGSLAFETPDVSPAAANGPLVLLLGSAYVAVRSAIFFLACFLLLLNRRLPSLIRNLTDCAAPSWPRWLLIHGLSFGLFLYVSVTIFGRGVNPSTVAWATVGMWVAIGCMVLIAALLIIAPATQWVVLLRETRREFALGLFASILVSFGSWFAGALWPSASDPTLAGVELILSPFYPLVRHESSNVVGTGSFYVDVSPACSGMEGVSLILLFSVVYLWSFRKQLRFPHALLLLPIGIVAIWSANVLRIAILIAIGASVSPEIALGGFHSQAGWIAFCGVALGLIFLSHRMLDLKSPSSPRTVGNGRRGGMPAALVVPFLCSLAASMAVDAASADFRAFYPFVVVATAAALWAFRHHYRGLLLPPSWTSIAIGVGVFAVWIAIVPKSEASGDALLSGIAALSPVQAAVWIAFRVVGCAITVPIAEELAFRGYLLRRLAGSSLESPSRLPFTWLSFVLSSVLFGLMHSDWLAGCIAGAGFAVALYHRGKTSDAIAAHMTSNVLIAFAVLVFGRWDLWA